MCTESFPQIYRIISVAKTSFVGNKLRVYGMCQGAHAQVLQDCNNVVKRLVGVVVAKTKAVTTAIELHGTCSARLPAVAACLELEDVARAAIRSGTAAWSHCCSFGAGNILHSSKRLGQGLSIIRL